MAYSTYRGLVQRTDEVMRVGGADEAVDQSLVNLTDYVLDNFGFSGFSGFSGWSGSNGTDGTRGISGFSGLSGTSGFSGTSGRSGFSGNSGVSGFSGVPGGSNTQVQFNDSGAFGGDADLTWNKTTNTLVAGRFTISDGVVDFTYPALYAFKFSMSGSPLYGALICYNNTGLSDDITRAWVLDYYGNLGLAMLPDNTSRLQLKSGTTMQDGIQWGTDTNLYRSAADTLKTDDNFAAARVDSAGALTGGATSISFASSITPNANYYINNVAQLTGNITTIANPSGTKVDGQTLKLRFQQDGTGSRTLTFSGSEYAFGDITNSYINTTYATASKYFEVIFEYHSASTKWRCVAVVGGF